MKKRKLIVRNRKRKKVYLVIFVSLFLLFGLGYSALNSNLEIIGSLKVSKYDRTLYNALRREAKTGSGKVVEYTGSSAGSYANKVYYYHGEDVDNNVLFGNYCWKIIRTNDTGGVKLLYNGLPSADNTCDNTGEDTILPETSPFNNENSSFSNVGYMYNKEYLSKFYYPSSSSTIIDVYDGITSNTSFNYYLSDSYEYNPETSMYTLKNLDGSDVQTFIWEESSSFFKGHYRCFYGETMTCSTLYYVLEVSSTSQYMYPITGGQTLDDVRGEMILGNGYEENDGVYTLTDTITVKTDDWYKDYASYRNYYICSDKTSTTCSVLHKILTPYSWRYYVSSTDVYQIYGNGVTYDEETSMYTLTDTVNVWNPNETTDLISNHHYTCFSSEDSCEIVNYVFYIPTKSNSEADYSTVNYVSLEGGQTHQSILDEMLRDEDVNQNESVIKQKIENWYEENMLPYNSLIEDAVYCNKRTTEPEGLGGWNPDGGSLFTSTSIASGRYIFNFTCPVETDRFQVSNPKAPLKYPVGLLTWDEFYYTSVVANGRYNNSLIGGATFWLMTPSGYTNAANVRYINESGTTGGALTNSSHGVRPVISLIPGIEIDSGNGTVNNPYIVTNSIKSM